MIKNSHLKKSSFHQIPPYENFIGPTKSFIFNYLSHYDVDETVLKKLDQALDRLLKILIEKSQTLYEDVPIEVKLEKRRRVFFIKLINKGIPFFITNGHTDLFEEMRKNIDFFNYKNWGRGGQQLTLGIKFKTLPPLITRPATYRPERRHPTEEIIIRPLEKGEEGKISALFYTVYGHSYIHEYIYYPEKIREMIENKKLISIVAVMGKDYFVGHVGLVKINSDPVVYEAALGVVNPQIKAQGLFGKLFKKTIDLVNEIPMQYCLYDFVTNHDYSQRQVYKYQSCEMAIMLGGQVATNQAKLERIGIGKDPRETDRYSILLAIRPQVEAPFGKEIVLPVNLGEIAEFLLTPLGIRWAPASRFYPLLHDGEYSIQINQAQKSVNFNFHHPGKNVLFKLVEEWRYLMRIGYQYASVDIPLDFPGVGQLYDFFTKNHFFISGFVPYNGGSKLALRLQGLAPTRVDFSEIHLFSDNAKKLLQLIKADYLRNAIL